jgi:hypothetical protein
MSTVTLANAYQKMGTQVPAGMSAADALLLAGMAGWNQRLVEPVVFDEDGTYPAGKHRYVVADLPTGPRILGPVLETYRPIQIEEAFVPLMDGFADAGLTPLVLGAYDDGKAAFIQFSVPEGLHTWGGDAIATTVLLTKRNDGTGAIKGFPDVERIACANAIRGVTRKVLPVVNVRHTKSADPYVAQTAERLLGITQDWNEAVGQEIDRLAATPMTVRHYADVFVPKVLGDRPEDAGRSQTIFDRQFDELVATWNSPVHVEGDSAWRAINAISEFEQHHRLIPGEKNEIRMARAVLNNRQPLTARALALLGV